MNVIRYIVAFFSLSYIVGFGWYTENSSDTQVMIAWLVIISNILIAFSFRRILEIENISWMVWPIYFSNLAGLSYFAYRDYYMLYGIYYDGLVLGGLNFVMVTVLFISELTESTDS